MSSGKLVTNSIRSMPVDVVDAASRSDSATVRPSSSKCSC